MLTTNLWSEVGLANSSMGTIHNMSWDAGQDISSMPLVILVKFDGYTESAFPDYGKESSQYFPLPDNSSIRV
jgi:hypothetical protein